MMRQEQLKLVGAYAINGIVDINDMKVLDCTLF